LAQQSGGKALLFAVGVFAAVYLLRDAGLDQPAPNFSLPETYGGAVDLASFHGRPVLLVFWTTSCGICRHELPLLDRMMPEFRSKGIEVVAIHLGPKEDARDYLRSNHIGVTCLVDAEGAVGQAYRVSGVPKMVMVGSDGKIKRSTAGMAGESVLREWMDVVSGT
jgi:peroxiredoxin